MLFYSIFKTLIGQLIIIHLKNDMVIHGKLESVDQFLNIKLDQVKVQDTVRYPHVVTLKNCFIRGSTVRYIELNKDSVDVDLLQDATRKESAGSRTTANNSA